MGIGWRAGFGCVLALSLISIARGQSLQERVDQQMQQLRRETRLMPNPDVPAAVRSSVDYGLYLTYNFIQVDDALVRRRRLQEYDLTAYARVNLDNVHDFLVRGVTSYREEKPFGVRDEEGWDFQLERLYYRYDLGQAIAGSHGEIPDGDLAIQIGRDLQYWGTGLTLALELDAVTLDFTYKNQFGLRLLAGTTPRDSIDIDSSRPGYTDDTKRAFFGALASARLGNHRPFGYVLVQRDHNPNSITQNSFGDDGTAQGITTAFDYNSVYWSIGSTGALGDHLAYGAELVYESGSALSRNPAAISNDGENTQQRDPIQALAANVQLDYLFSDPHNTRLSGSLIYASGDDDRLNATNTFNGNAPGTHDHAFNAFGLLNTGLAYNPDVANLICTRIGGSTFPFTSGDSLSHLQTGVDVFAFFKADRDGGVAEPSTSNRYLGCEGDFYLNWQLTSDVTASVRYGLFLPGSGLVADDDERHAFFISLTVGL